MKNYDYDLAVIMKKVVFDNGLTGFVPETVVEGYYDENEMNFCDFEGTVYYHIIDEPETYGFCGRISFEELKNNYPLLNSNIIKSTYLHNVKKYQYLYVDEDSTEIGIPILSVYDKKTNSFDQYFDGDVVLYYYYNYPEYFQALSNTLIDPEDEMKENNAVIQDNFKSQIDVKKLYKEVTSKVIDQDEPIKKILTAIWKQYSDFSENKSRNILINGSTGVGKTEIFRVLSKLLDVPCVITSANEYSAVGFVGKSVDDMLVSLVKKANGDIKKAERGILIIDEIDKISSTDSRSSVNQRDVQEALLKILEDGVFNITIGNMDYEFDTSKLLVIGMGSFSRIDLTPPKALGFGKETVKKTYKDITREDMIANGMIPELVGRFPVIVQMNELTYDSFIRILKSKNNSLMLNKEFLSKQGIELSIKEDLFEAIADKASKSKFGARGLDEMIEKALSVASFEIASNPDMYSELIIDKDTIEDNKKYTLVKKLSTVELIEEKNLHN